MKSGCASIDKDYKLKNHPRHYSRHGRRKPSISTRLSLPVYRTIDKLRKDFAPPMYSVPALVKHLFPKIEQLSLETKLPHLYGLEGGPNGLYYTRGKLGTNFMEETGLQFTVEDEYNQRKTPKMSSYDPLHDPHLAHYLQRPIIKEQLVAQGLVRHNGNVVCNLKYFNEFRKCSGMVQNEQLAELLRKKHMTDIERLREIKSLVEWKADEVHRSCDNAMAKRKAHDTVVRNRIIDKFTLHESRRKRADQLKADILEEREGCSICRENRRRIAYDKTKLPKIDARHNIMMRILQREQATELRLASDRMALKKFKTLRDLHNIQGKINAQLNAKGLTALVQTTFDSILKKKAKECGQGMRKKWDALPTILANRRAEETRILNLARKYFYKWLNQVRERRRQRSLAAAGHVSHWNVTNTIDKVNDGLCSDRIKFVNIKTLIAAAKRQVEIEETNDEVQHKNEEENRVVLTESMKLVSPRAILEDTDG